MCGGSPGSQVLEGRRMVLYNYLIPGCCSGGSRILEGETSILRLSGCVEGHLGVR